MRYRVLVVRVSGEQARGVRFGVAPGYGYCWATRPGRSLPHATGSTRSATGIAGRAVAVLGYYRQMPEAVELRLHDTPLYNSVYRLDDEMLVNVHA